MEDHRESYSCRKRRAAEKEEERDSDQRAGQGATAKVTCRTRAGCSKKSSGIWTIAEEVEGSGDPKFDGACGTDSGEARKGLFSNCNYF